MMKNLALEELYNIEKLSHKKGYRTYMASSYDREGGNFDFGNYENRIDDVGILLDVDGPGVITRFWSANPMGQLKVYIDGEEEPILDMPFEDYMGSSPLSFGKGLTYRDPGPDKIDYKPYGFTSYCLIPFENGCKVTVTPASSHLYYQVNYSLWDEKALDSSKKGVFEGLEDEYEKMDSEIGGIWKYSEEALVEEGTVSMEPGESIDILDLEGSYEILSMEFQLEYPEDDLRKRHIMEGLLLRGYWDEDLREKEWVERDYWISPIPAIKSPLAYFFGDYGNYDDYKTMFTEKYIDGGKIVYRGRFPMPFKRRGRLLLLNKSCFELDNIKYRISYVKRDEILEDEYYFHALYHHEDSTFGYDLGNYRDEVMYHRNSDGEGNYRILYVAGEGHLVGTSFHVDFSETPFSRALYESDEAVFVDDDPKRTMWGTGNEDYINDAWGFHPVKGSLSGGRWEDSEFYGYRFHVADAIPFRKKLLFTLEHGTSNNCTAEYRSVAYYYMKPKERDEYINGVPERSMKNYFTI